MKTLIVDDNEQNLYMLEQLFKGLDHEVVTAVNGEDALDKLDKGGFSMIISDILMPVMDGFQFCRKVKTNKVLKEILFIFYTSTYTEEKDKEFALKIGADRFLRKPMEPDVFVRMIRETVANMANGDTSFAEPDLVDEKDVLKVYSERLINRLEHKAIALEEEVTRRRDSEEKLKHLNSVLCAIRGVNQLIVREKDHNRLIQGACEELILTRGYSNAWIALLDESKNVVTIAEAGLGQAFLPLREHLNKGEFPYCARSALDQSGALIIKDPVSECYDCPLARMCKGQRGLAVRLEHIGKIYGIMTVSLPGNFIDNEEEQSLFNEVASDIGLALYSIEGDKKRKRTEEKNVQLEGKYRQAQKMESVGRLAGGVAHDFNNALSVIIGIAEMALDDTDPIGQLHEDLNEILTAAGRAADITRQLLAFARRQTIAPKIIELNDTVGSMLKMLRRLIGEDIDLAWLPGANLWSVKMDPTQIDQVLANLCVNARDAIEGVGKVTIESENVTFTEDYCADHAGFVQGEFVQLSVSDDGCGMNKEILDNIFEPFFTTKDMDKGTGLGLATVYGIAKQNNGFINVYSEPDKGTTIKIYLPRHEAKAAELHKKSREEIPIGQGETVLVVEDDPLILKMMQKILQGLGYTVMTSSAPEKTMGIVKEYTGKIHLLITDVIMPKMNGHDLAELLQSICPDLKCIFMSGYTADAIVKQGVLNKGVNFIQKPFSRRELAEIIRKVLEEA